MGVYNRVVVAVSLVFVAALATLLVEGLAPLPLSAQNVGDRVRVSAPGLATVGEVTAVNDEGFQMGIRGSFLYREIERLERSMGQERQWKKGLGYGAAIGAGVGVLGGVVLCDELGGCDDGWDVVIVGLSVLTYAPLGGLVGLGVGALVKRESWTDIPFAGTDLGLAPMVEPGATANTVRLGVRIAH